MSEFTNRQESTHGPQCAELFLKSEVKELLANNFRSLISSGVYSEYVRLLSVEDVMQRNYKLLWSRSNVNNDKKPSIDDFELGTEFQDSVQAESPLIVHQTRESNRTTFYLAKFTPTGYIRHNSDIELFSDNLDTSELELADDATLTIEQVEVIRQIYHEQESVGIVVFDELPDLDVSGLFDIEN